jgi:hypothetical protein
LRKLPKLLSKTKVMRGYRCLKNVYQTIHNPDLEAPITKEQQALFDQGNQVGEDARKKFPGGVLVDNKPWDFFGSLKATRELIKNEKIIYEAAFEYKGCYARADVIVFSDETKRWSVYEVKSSTKVKPEHIDDVGLQSWIIANSGLPIESIFVLHLNPECVFPNLENLFVEENVTELLRERYSDIAPKLNEIFGVIRQESIPAIDLGPYCLSPGECGFKDACWKEKKIPKVSVFNLPKINDKKWKLYDEGIISLNDERLSGLSDLQQRVVDSYTSGERFIDRSVISSELKAWKYPFTFLDFETALLHMTHLPDRFIP